MAFLSLALPSVREDWADKRSSLSRKNWDWKTLLKLTHCRQRPQFHIVNNQKGLTGTSIY